MQDEYRDDIREAKQAFLDGGYSGFDDLLKKLPKSCYIEKSLVQGLKKAGGQNYFQAIVQVPRNVRNLYLHALQVILAFIRFQLDLNALTERKRFLSLV